MQLFIAVLTESEYVSTILKKFADNNYHGSVLETKSIRHALRSMILKQRFTQCKIQTFTMQSLPCSRIRAIRSWLSIR